MTSAYHEYIADVLAGAFVTSGKIKKLCAKLKARGDTYKRWHYDQARADHAISFIEAFCCQTAGDWTQAPPRAVPEVLRVGNLWLG